VAGWVSECTGALLEEGRRRGRPGRRRGAVAGRGQGGWGGARLKEGLTGGPHLSAGGREEGEGGGRADGPRGPNAVLGRGGKERWAAGAG
jgi:hypothetical protein